MIQHAKKNLYVEAPADNLELDCNMLLSVNMTSIIASIGDTI